MKQPVFFISSTIKDFKDLRSSIKWWLEENNYIVNASEFNDFGKPIDDNSYEACLKAIDNSDYFILLIGNRNGGMYDDEITITQKEYQYAYQKMLSGTLKIINFIRLETWTNFLDSKNKIKELEKNKALDKSSIDKIFTDEEKIRFTFIDEVRRVKEMKEGDKPKNNWVHTFETFKDLTEVFRQELGEKLDLNFKQNRFVIVNDIKRNLLAISSKDESSIGLLNYMIAKLWDDFIVNPDKSIITLTHQQYLNYASFYVSCMQVKPLKTSRIESFYKAGFFLDYDKNINDFISGDNNLMAVNLLNIYERLNNLHKKMYEDSNNKLIKLSKKKDQSHLKVTQIEILLALEFNDELLNCHIQSKNLYKSLMGKDYSLCNIIKHDRLSEDMKPKEEETITEVEIFDYLNS